MRPDERGVFWKGVALALVINALIWALVYVLVRVLIW